jgi:hypothetical protein
MRLFGREIDSYPKALVALVAVFLASSGLCGVQWAIAGSLRGRGIGPLAPFIIFLGVVELAAMALSAIGILVLLMIWPISIMYNRFAKPPNDRVQRLFDKEDAVDEDDPL